MPLLVILYIYITQAKIDNYNAANNASLDRNDVIAFMLDVLSDEDLQDDLFEARRHKKNGIEIINIINQFNTQGSGRIPAATISGLEAQMAAIQSLILTPISDEEAQLNAAALGTRTSRQNNGG